MLVYDWLNQYMHIILRLLETWSDTSDVTTPVLKLFSELVNNSSQRIRFAVNSADGIVLFRHASKVLQTYGNRVLSIKDQSLQEGDSNSTASTDVYKAKLKGN
jgi:hypothetical protein